MWVFLEQPLQRSAGLVYGLHKRSQFLQTSAPEKSIVPALVSPSSVVSDILCLRDI